MKRMKVISVNDIKIPVDYSLSKTGITQSLLSTFVCKKRFLFSINRFSSKDTQHKTAFGSLIHQVLDNIYSSGVKPSEKKVKRYISRYLKKVEYPKSLQKTMRDKVIATILLSQYIKFYADDFTKKKFFGVEQSFEVKFKNTLLRGKIDGKFKINGKRWLMEHKTKGRVDEEMLSLTLGYDLQNLLYLTAEELQTGKSISGVLYNIIRVPGERQGKKETEIQFYQRLKKKVASTPSHYFIRFEVPYTEQDKKQFRKELSYMLQEVQMFLDGKLLPWKNRAACEIPYKCAFLKACSSGSLAGYEQKDELFMELKGEE